VGVLLEKDFGVRNVLLFISIALIKMMFVMAQKYAKLFEKKKTRKCRIE